MKTKIVHYQSSTGFVTGCGLSNTRLIATTMYIDDVTCSNCKRNKVFKARGRLEKTAKRIREREMNQLKEN